MALSVNNSSTALLANNATFSGKYDDVLQYSEINISLHTNITYNLSIYYSTDKINDDYTETITIDEVASDARFFTLQPKERYFKLKLTATSAGMTLLRLQTTYKLSKVYKPQAETVNANITNQITGFAKESTLSTVSSAVDTTNTKLDSINSKLVDNGSGLLASITNEILGVRIDVSNSQISGQLWSNGVSTGAGGVSSSFSPISVGSTITFFGNCLSTDTLLTVQYSYDGATWYNSSHSFNAVEVADFDYTISRVAVNQVRVISSNDSNLDLFYCVR